MVYVHRMVKRPQDDVLPAVVFAAPKATAPVVDKGAVARRYDAKMHEIISAVVSGGGRPHAWMNCVETLARDVDNLRPGVLFRFFSVCKFSPAEKAMWEKLGWRPVAEKVMHRVIDALEAAGDIGRLRNYFSAGRRYELPVSVRERLWGKGDADGVFKTISRPATAKGKK